MEALIIIALAVAATIGWALYQHGSWLVSRLRTTPSAPPQSAAVVETSEEGFGLLEQGLLANQVHQRVFAGIKKFSDGFEDNVKSCSEIRKQLSLPLGGGV